MKQPPYKGNVVKFPGSNEEGHTPASVLAGTPEDLDIVLVMGTRADGTIYFNSSSVDGGDIMWLMEVAKFTLISPPVDV